MSQEIRAMPEEMDPELWRGFKSPRPRGKAASRRFFVTPGLLRRNGFTAARARLADRGLEGDRFFRDSWNAVNRSDKAVSLVEDEVLQLAAEELGRESIADKNPP